MRRKYGPLGPEPTHTTLAVSFAGLDAHPQNYDKYIREYTSEVLGGPTIFRLKNLGPVEATDVSVELLTPSLHARTALAWAHLAIDGHETFSVNVPFGDKRMAKLRWSQGQYVLTRKIELPTGEVE
jgi:hypothetical protein